MWGKAGRSGIEAKRRREIPRVIVPSSEAVNVYQDLRGKGGWLWKHDRTLLSGTFLHHCGARVIRPVRSRANSRHMQFLSTAAERCGCAEREAIGQNVSNLMPKPDRSQHYGYMTRYRASGERHIIRMPAA
jgi:hypothetical protein